MKNALVVGSSLIDLFLTPEESHAQIIGENVSLMLGDKIPTQINKLALGGNGANVSVGLARLSINTSFYTWLGKDILSKEIEDTIEKEGVKLLTSEERGTTTGLSLILNFGRDRIIFSHHEVEDHAFEIKEEIRPDIIYLTSIGERWKESYTKVLSFSQNNNSILAFSPGSKQIENINDVFMQTLQKTKMLFVNKEEARKILVKAGKDTQDNKSILESLSLLGPQIISVTDGARGAFARDSDGKMYIISAVPNQNTINKAGAGDSYATGFLAAILSEKDVSDAMIWGSLNAYSVMTELGAQQGLLTLEKMQNELTSSSIKTQSIE